MHVWGDVNAVTAITAAVASFVISRVVAVRQARANTREVGRRSLQALVAPLLGHVRLLIESSKEQREDKPKGRVDSWSKITTPDLLRDIARATDDMGRLRRRQVRRLARLIFGQDFLVAYLGRLSAPSEVFGAMLRAQYLAKPHRKPRQPAPAMWTAAQQRNPSIRLIRVLEAKLGRLYACPAAAPDCTQEDPSRGHGLRDLGSGQPPMATARAPGRRRRIAGALPRTPAPLRRSGEGPVR